MADINHYSMGDTISFSAQFRDTANALTDTAKPTLIIVNPAGASAVYTYPADANVVRAGTGSWYATAYIPTGSASARGTWTYIFLSTSGVMQSQIGRFAVDQNNIWPNS